MPVKTDASSFEAGTPVPLFAVRLPYVTPRNRYLATPDGQRFLLNMTIDDGASSMNVVLNWTAELKK